MAENALQVVDRQTLPVRQSFEPTNLQEAMEFSKMIAESELAPPNFRGKPANVLVALQMGRELNVPPLQALQGIAVINSRAVIYGDLMWALVTTHPAYEDAIEEVTDTYAKITLKRRGRTPVTVTFSKDDAVKAGLWDKAGPWKQYSKRQMQWRARTFAARDLFPDALKGMTSAEEAQDYGPTIEGNAQPSAPSTPAAATEQKPAAEETIGQSGGSAFFKAYKASGWAPEEAKKWLADNLQIGPPHNEKNSKDIPVSQKDKAMTWANTASPIKTAVTQAFDILGFTAEERAAFFALHKDFKAVHEALLAEAQKRDAAERGE